ncbi:uncharacterized protein LOC144129398 [Amblyomma americanum]
MLPWPKLLKCVELGNTAKSKVKKYSSKNCQVEVNAVLQMKSRCNKCARVHNSETCPAKGRTCLKCGKRHHFAAACKTKSANLCAKEQKVASLEANSDGQADNFWLQTLSPSSKKDDRWTAIVKIEETPVACKLDTGANCSVISRSQLQKITQKQPENCAVVLNTFFGFQKKATKRSHLHVTGPEGTFETTFFVMEDDIPVTLSGSVAEKLGLIRRIASLEHQELYDVVKPYEDVFSGLGELKGVVYHLKLKPGSQGVVKAARRIPFALEDSVKAELDRMEAAGVVSNVTEPTEWSSHMVTVIKNDKESVKYLGHVLTRDGLSLDPGRLEDIFHVQAPCNRKELQTFLASDRRLEQVLRETDRDPSMVKLRQYASTAWPIDKADVTTELRSYWSFRDELHTESGLVFRSNRLIIPARLRNEVLASLHAAHTGAEKMKARARTVVFWPSINSDIEEVAQRCQTCQKYKSRNARLPLLSHEIPTLPWESIGADICHHNGAEYLVVVDFYSFFFEIRLVQAPSANKVIAACNDIFATHGFPRRLCTDNGPPFSSQQFKDYADKIGLQHDQMNTRVSVSADVLSEAEKDATFADSSTAEEET